MRQLIHTQREGIKATEQGSTCLRPRVWSALGVRGTRAAAMACSCCCRMLLMFPRNEKPFCRP